jgi:NADPH2:quinone reductase
MHAWQFDEYGSYEDVLHWADCPDPQVGPGQALVRVSAVSLNFPDLLICQGLYQTKATLPAIPGLEGCGVIEAVGEGSTFEVGDRVVGFAPAGGTLAERFVVNDISAWRVPDHVSDVQAAALSCTYGTSYFGLVHRAQLKPGEVLLVTGAAGGVGTAAVELGKAFGATVIAAAGSAEKLEICRDLGADQVIDYTTEDLVERVKELTDGTGADVIYDPVGGDAFDRCTRCINWEGRIIVVGFASGRIPSIECNRILLKSIAVVGVAWGAHITRNPRLGEACQQHLYEMLAEGRINPVIFRTLPLTEAKQGLRLMESRELYGKIVLTHRDTEYE